MDMIKRRDLSIVKLDGGKSLVIACDSCGGVGSKQADMLPAAPFFVGSYTARVALMEVLAAGAEIVSVTNNICNEMRGTGTEIIEGIKRELHEAGIDADILTGSTEENFETKMTALGVTVIGLADNNKLRFSKGRDGDVFVLLGLPKVAGEVVLGGDGEIASYRHIKALLNDKNVLEIVPVGSKGIAHECGLIAGLNNKTFMPREDCAIDLKKSAGPATCLVALVSKGFDISALNERCAAVIGRLHG